MRILFLILASVFIVALSSCKTYMGYDELRHLKRGMSVRQAEKEFDLEPSATYNITHEGTTYEARKYSMQIGTTQSTNITGGYVGAHGVFVPTTTYNKKYANTIGYILLFHENRLLYWGFLTEFSKSEDPQILNLSAELRRLYYSE